MFYIKHCYKLSITVLTSRYQRQKRYKIFISNSIKSVIFSFIRITKQYQRFLWSNGLRFTSIKGLIMRERVALEFFSHFLNIKSFPLRNANENFHVNCPALSEYIIAYIISLVLTMVRVLFVLTNNVFEKKTRLLKFLKTLFFIEH